MSSRRLAGLFCGGVAIGCAPPASELPAPPTPPSRSVADTSASSRTPPAFLPAVVAGSGRRVEVPVWLDLRGCGDLEEALDEVQAFELEEGHVVAIEQASSCALPVCGVFDPERDAWSAVECPPHTGHRFTLQPMGDATWLLYSFMEGPGEGQVIRWRPGQRLGEAAVLLPFLTHPTLERGDDGAWILESQLDPGTGAPPPELVARCGDPPDARCFLDGAPSWRWGWREGAPPRRLERATPR